MATYADVLRSIRRKRASVSGPENLPWDPRTIVSEPETLPWDPRTIVSEPEMMGGQMGMDVASDPLAFAGGASVVNPLGSMNQSYNPAGGWAEAGRLAPDNIAAANVAAMNQVTQPFGGMTGRDRIPDINQGNDLWWAGAPGYDTEGTGAGYPGMGVENRGFPHGITAEGAVDPSTGQLRVVPPDTSVVAPPRMPTEKETLDREVMGPADDRAAAFSRIHNMWARNPGGDYGGYETEWAEGIGVPKEYIDFYMQVPLEAKMYAHENKGDAKIQQDFEEKYGFVLDVDVPLQGGMERSDLLNLRSTGIPDAP